MASWVYQFFYNFVLVFERISEMFLYPSASSLLFDGEVADASVAELLTPSD